MAKSALTIEDFSGGINGYLSDRKIEDNQFTKSDIFIGTTDGLFEADNFVLKYPDNTNSITTADAQDIEIGYGLFMFSHDYAADGTLVDTTYIILQDITEKDFAVYHHPTLNFDHTGTWIENAISMGAKSSGNAFTSYKPCFYFAGGAVRISPGNFESKDSDGDIEATLSGDFLATTIYGDHERVVADTDITDDVDIGDTIVIDDQEMIVGNRSSTALTSLRNMNGLFPKAIDASAANDDIYVALDTRWYGVVNRRNFGNVTSLGTFTEWYATYQHPRPPVSYDADMRVSASGAPIYTFPFMTSVSSTVIVPSSTKAPAIVIGIYVHSPNDAGQWEGATVQLYVTALYDEIKQESLPAAVSSDTATPTTFTVAAGKELGVGIVVDYSDADTAAAYHLNKRVTGARVYYEDTTNDPGILWQMIEVDFERGCRKVDAESFTPWVELRADEVAGSHSGVAIHTNRTTDNGGAFIFELPPKILTYEDNTGCPPNINTHARYKTATLCNNRMYIGNVYQGGRAYADRMVVSLPQKFDLFPEMEPNVIRIAAGDGDAIVKLEAWDDRVLQFKKRTLYIINAAGEIGSETLESQHKNMGVENPSQVCQTEYGVAWVNTFGVFLYDGSEITDLTRGILKKTDSSSNSRALNVTESNIPSVAYAPKHRHLLVQKGIASDDGWIYDFVHKSWWYNRLLFYSGGDNYKTNVVGTPDNNTVYFSVATNDGSTSPAAYSYKASASTVSHGTNYVSIYTKVFNLGSSKIKKKLTSVFVTYSAAANTKIEADILYTRPAGSTTDDLAEADSGSTYYTEANGFLSTGGSLASPVIRTVELVPTTPVNDAYTFQLWLHNPDAAYPTNSYFKIYDIEFVYREINTSKISFMIDDFSGGTNGYAHTTNVEDNEYTRGARVCSHEGNLRFNWKRMDAYPTQANPITSNDAQFIEPGYGLFMFSHDNKASGALEDTTYIVLQDITEKRFDVYYHPTLNFDHDGTWVQGAFNYGAMLSDGEFAEYKPCFYFADGAVRSSPGNFESKDSGANLKDHASGWFLANAIYGGWEEVDAVSGLAADIESGDTVVIDGQEMILAATDDTNDKLWAIRNMTGLFPATVAWTVTSPGDKDDIRVVLDTRWYGVASRRNFSGHTTIGTFTEWYSTYQHPRPPVRFSGDFDSDNVSTEYLCPFMQDFDVGNLDVTGDYSPSILIGYLNTEDHADGQWGGATIRLYITALYDDIRQESQPSGHTGSTGKTVDTFTVAAGKELGVGVVVAYSDDNSNYDINKRVTGARVYYEDITNDPGVLWQLLEIDFELGCKKADAGTFTPWVELNANEVVGSHDGTATASNRTTGNGDAFIFEYPPKLFSYEDNTGIPPDINTHARYKTATLCNNRMYIGNVYQSGSAHADRMIASPAHKFDIFPEMEPNIIRVATDDGDEIVKLETWGDRILQFKKRTLYIINAAGEIGSEALESKHKNMGVENPSQTCHTEYGVAWVNSTGVYLYDGSVITNLIDKKLKLTDTTNRYRALNIIEADIPSIGYSPADKWLVVGRTCNNLGVAGSSPQAGSDECWVYNFIDEGWFYHKYFNASYDFRTNMIWSPQNFLLNFAATNVSGDAYAFAITALTTTGSVTAGNIEWYSKEFDLGEPGTKKKLNSVFVTYSAADDTSIEADIIYKHPAGTTTDDLAEADSGTTYYTEALGFKSTAGSEFAPAIRTVELVPTTPVTNAYTFQLKLHNPDENADLDTFFTIYDIEFVYREMGIR